MTMQPLYVCLAVVVWLGLAAAPAVGAKASRKADFYISTKGDDSWSGRLAAPNKARTDGPFATLARAQEAVREARDQAADRPYTVLVRGGTYTLREPVVFGPQDSGSEGAPVTHAAYPGERPVFSGGRLITGWRKGDGEIWTAQVPEVRAGQWYFHQLWVNGRRATRARTPNEGYLRTAGPLPEIKSPQAERQNPAAKIGFSYRDRDLQVWDGLDDVNVFVYHSWTSSLHWIQSLDEEQHTVRFTAGAHWPMGWWEREQRYHVEHYLEALDEPGEWYLDRKTGVLHYWPRPEEDMGNAEVVAPVLRELVRFEGDPENGQYVDYLTLRGLCFQHADWHIENKGEADGQAAVFLSGAVYARGGRHCTIERCEIAHVGQYGLWLAAGCQDNRVFHCEVHDLGGGGVKIGEQGSPANEGQTAARNVVDNCFIHDGGHVFPAGVGVWIGRSSDHTVSHNEICDFYYTGVSVGWSWGYAPSSANHNIIEYNHIHHLGKGVLSDMGAIYTLGVSPGTVLRYTLAHDIHSYSYGGWGLYTDEGSTDILLENNIVYNTKTGGFHQHYGRENIVRNNIFAFSQEGQLIRSREEEHVSFTLERNIIYCDNGRVLGSNWNNGQYRLDYNLYWDVSDAGIEFAGLAFDEWQAKGQDEHSLVKDPMFVDAARRDFRLKPGSPALALGSEPIDASQIGLYGEREWVSRPKGIVRTGWDFVPPEPQPIKDGFEKTAVGQLPGLAVVSGEEKGASIRVTDEAAKSGKHSLKFTDAPGLEHIWQPHMFYQPRYDTGIAHLGFDVRVERGASLVHEWRDSANPYHVGPSVSISSSGELKAGNQTLLTVPLGEWVRLAFVCALGSRSTGTYDLTVTVAGQPPRKFPALVNGSPQFRRLHWLGFISVAGDTAAFYLDNVDLARDVD